MAMSNHGLSTGCWSPAGLWSWSCRDGLSCITDTRGRSWLEVGQGERRDEQVGDGVAEALVSQRDEYQRSVADDDENRQYRQHHVLQRQLVVGQHSARAGFNRQSAIYSIKYMID